jgi:hypothetical protein
MPYPLELLKHCINLSGDFWNVCAFFLLLSSAFWVGNSCEINNVILEVTSIRGWFKLNRPLFGVCGGLNTGLNLRDPFYPGQKVDISISFLILDLRCRGS